MKNVTCEILFYVSPLFSSHSQYFKEDGWVHLNNRLHIFRSVEDEVFDYHSYPLNCAYEEIVNFEYDLKGLSGPGSWNGLTLKFWESNEFKVEKNDYKFEIGEQIYMSFSWADIAAGFSYAIKYCAITPLGPPCSGWSKQYQLYIVHLDTQLCLIQHA